MAVINPYQEIIRQIEQKSQLDEQRANTAAEQQKQQAYVGYMTAKRDLGETLASQGIMGGGTESATLGANVGYQRQRNVVDSNRASEVNAIRQNRMANWTATESQAVQWENDQQALAEQRFANTVGGYDTIPKVEAAIQAAQISGEDYKVNYLLLQRAAIVEREKAAAEEAAYRASLIGGGGGDDPVVDTTPRYSDDATPSGYTSSAPLALSVPVYQRPIVATNLDPNPYAKPIPTQPRTNPYYR